MRKAFVKEVLQELVGDSVLSTRSSILAVCAWTDERDVFNELGFDNVTISNLNDSIRADEFAPFEWSHQDAQSLTYEDRTFDFVFVADGLHHCSSPHLALIEMYRVSRTGVIVFESRDSFLMKAGEMLNLTPQYELEAVVDNGFVSGGMNNTGLPNHIYRWTENEFRKAIRSYDPTGRHDFRFFYGLNLPFDAAALRKSKLKLIVLHLARPFVWVFTKLFKKQCNTFGMVALRPKQPDENWPWLTGQSGSMVVDREYAKSRFKVD